MPSIINERIRKYRKEKKLSQGQLAAKLGIKTSTYSQMEREGNVSADMVLRIAAELGIDPNLIFYGTQATPQNSTILTFHSPNKLEETLYGPQSVSKLEKEEIPKNHLPFTLSNTEKNIITIYHNLPKAQQKEIRECIDTIRKRGR
ncbi:MAG: helix-turn-helix domain-containing protein [Clostridia bacterium]|nr:helix-turn-helix domain-containing protein [Clostridia bacterium]